MELSFRASATAADFPTTLATEAQMPASNLYELDNVEGQSVSPFVKTSTSMPNA
jgi:hypothetical protein